MFFRTKTTGSRSSLQIVEKRWEDGRARQRVIAQPERVKNDDPSPLKVKPMWVEDRRYVVCLNEDEARKDAADRQAIVMSLREQLRPGDKSLVANKGYRRYLGSSDEDHFPIDEAKIAEDSRYDGKWVLGTNTDLETAAVALRYKEPWFRSSQTLLQTRPIYHRRDATIRGRGSQWVDVVRGYFYYDRASSKMRQIRYPTETDIEHPSAALAGGPGRRGRHGCWYSGPRCRTGQPPLAAP